MVWLTEGCSCFTISHRHRGLQPFLAMFPMLPAHMQIHSLVWINLYSLNSICKGKYGQEFGEVAQNSQYVNVP